MSISFVSENHFHSFRKQRDDFYNLFREWQSAHNQHDWNCDLQIGPKIRFLIQQISIRKVYNKFQAIIMILQRFLHFEQWKLFGFLSVICASSWGCYFGTK